MTRSDPTLAGVAVAAGTAAPPRPRLRALGGGDRPEEPPAAVPRRLRVLVAAQEELLHWAFARLLGEQPWVAGCVVAATTAAALDAAARTAVDVAVVAPLAGDRSGLTVTAALTRRAPATRVLIVCERGGMSPAAARAAGAAGIILRSWTAADHVRAVRLAGAGRTVFTTASIAPAQLSERERDIIRLIADGATNREIASQLYLSPHTVKQQASALYRKLEARNRAEAVQRAQRLGLFA